MVERRALPLVVVIAMAGWLVLRAGIAPAFADPRVYSDVQQRGEHVVLIRAGAVGWRSGRKDFCVFISRNGTLVDSPTGASLPGA